MGTARESLERAVENSGLPPDIRILVAVSGGPDSIALLDTVHRLASQHQWRLRIGHVNHHLRGAESEADEAFVAHVARERGIPLDIAAVNTAELAARSHLSVEAAARRLRYDSLSHMLRAWNGDVILTGHTADDQAETLVMRLVRSSGLAGLSGIRRQNGALIRPFLAVRHETILAALQEGGLGYRLDSSNADQRHLRNRVRRAVIPVLERISPTAVPALAHTAELLAGDASYLLSEASESVRYLVVDGYERGTTASTSLLRALHPALQRHAARALIRVALGEETDISTTTVREVLSAVERASAGTPVERTVQHGLRVCARARSFSLRTGRDDNPAPWPSVEMSLPGETHFVLGRFTVTVEDGMDRDDLDRAIGVCGPFHAFCDADRLGSTLVLRSRRAGDRLRPLGAPGSRKLQDILVDRKVERQFRDRVLVVQDAEGLVWVPRFALSQRVAVTPATVRVAHLCFHPHPARHRDRMSGRILP